jgi:3-hydroxybutyryl-CoA dehydrogenase
MLKLNRVGVIGAGTMGRGIAQWFLQQGCEVLLVDSTEQALIQSCEQLKKQFEQLVQKQKITPPQFQELWPRFSQGLFSQALVELGSCDLLIEAIIEDETAKMSCFQSLLPHLQLTTLLATNTSSLSVETLSRVFPPSFKKHFVGLHFFNPAPLMPLVEIVQTSTSSAEVSAFLLEWFQQHKKIPVLCADRPGFIVNRVNRPYYLESFHILASSGHYAKEDTQENFLRGVDHILQSVGGMKLGPYALMDMIGLDINFKVTQELWERFHYMPRYRPHWIQERLVQQHQLGKKTGHGLYHYE